MEAQRKPPPSRSSSATSTIQHRIAQQGVRVLCTIFLLQFFTVSAFSIYRTTQRVQDDAAEQAMLIANFSAQVVSLDDRHGAHVLLQALKMKSDVVSAIIRKNDGRILARFDRDANHSDCRLEDLAFKALHYWRCGLQASVPIVFQDMRVGAVDVRMALQPTLAQLWVFFLVNFSISLALAFGSILSWRKLARRITEPIADLVAETLRATQGGAPRIEISKGCPTEVEVLGNALDKLLKDATARELLLRRELHQRKLVEEKLSVLAYADAVSGLHNRHYFIEKMHDFLQHSSARGERVALLYIDLDGFKFINDTFGHPVGDKLLREVAERLRFHLRDSDALCRMGGDEFGVLVRPLHRADDAGVVAQKLIEQVGLPYHLEGHTTLRVTASVGGAVYPDDARDGVSLVSAADQALLRAKASGKARYCRAGYTKEEARAQQLLYDLPSALGRGELFVLYQPKVRVDTLQGSPRFQTVAVEALLRWQHPGLGLIGPSEFIEMAEFSGHIVEMGKWVLQTACAQLTSLRCTLGLDLHLSINLSPSQLMNEGAIDELITVLKASGLPANTVALELTESAFVDRSDETLDRMSKLRRAGFDLSVDDFGTGYSSLAYLSQFPLTMLKLDRSFIKDVADSPRSHAVAKAIVMLAQALNLELVAEGVETVEQSACLAAMDANMLQQGYFFARPMTGNALSDWLASTQMTQPPQQALTLPMLSS